LDIQYLLMVLALGLVGVQVLVQTLALVGVQALDNLLMVLALGLVGVQALVQTLGLVEVQALDILYLLVLALGQTCSYTSAGAARCHSWSCPISDP